MKVTYPLSTGDGDEYLILIEYLEKSLFPDDVINILGDVNIADITLERVSGNSITHPKVLLEIANLIGGFLLDNEDTIRYNSIVMTCMRLQEETPVCLHRSLGVISLLRCLNAMYNPNKNQTL
ncbi:MAG: hypothetical protein IJZ86_06805 [Bacteroides sp.]|nr:hypothetical protein [Bacteroides sp.]